MNITPDEVVFLRWGPVVLNATIVWTWAVMALLVLGSLLLTARLRVEPPFSRRQVALEAIVGYMRGQIREITRQDPSRYLPFIGTLFLFISVSNLLAIFPLYRPPTGSLTTASALAICVFFAVPGYGIAGRGWGYFRHYVRPSVLMLPFNIIGELSRTLALAVRLFGNVMSGELVVAILVSIVPLFLPVVMQALGLLIGQIQAFIFAVLAAVYIGSASRARVRQEKKRAEKSESRSQNSEVRTPGAGQDDEDKDEDEEKSDGREGESAG